MKEFKVKLNLNDKLLIEAILNVIESGGFMPEHLQSQEDEAVIQCNSDTEFAELMIEVGEYIEKHS